jgi:hypothetical protein
VNLILLFLATNYDWKLHTINNGQDQSSGDHFVRLEHKMPSLFRFKISQKWQREEKCPASGERVVARQPLIVLQQDSTNMALTPVAPFRVGDELDPVQLLSIAQQHLVTSTVSHNRRPVEFFRSFCQGPSISDDGRIKTYKTTKPRPPDELWARPVGIQAGQGQFLSSPLLVEITGSNWSITQGQMETTSSLTSDTFSFEFPSWENSKQRKHD